MDSKSADRASAAVAHTARHPIVRFALVLLPHLALTVVFSLYLCMGAWAFMALERGSSDVEVLEKDRKGWSDMMDLLGNCTKDDDKPPSFDGAMTGRDSSQGPPHHPPPCGGVSVRGVWDNMMANMTTKNDWKQARMQSIQSNRAWSFYSAMLFCLTTVTTIGE